ncbi:hypothetical protein AMECASPLE_020488 [Ameca splendens]|uniref:Uncharacterized protein n=1 Tax=Ameca splendens TaxID=208324 RepID=A0ABV0XGA9_9TELE
MDFVDWCECNLLCFNTSKTKEMVIESRRRTPPQSPVNIQGEDIESLESFMSMMEAHIHHGHNLLPTTPYCRGDGAFSVSR